MNQIGEKPKMLAQYTWAKTRETGGNGGPLRPFGFTKMLNKVKSIQKTRIQNVSPGIKPPPP